MKMFVSVALAVMSLAAPMGVFAQSTAPKPLYRDPVYDGAADVSIIYDARAQNWKMFYTNRRATLKFGEGDVSWVHGTPIGVAVSGDGVSWKYQGMADIPKSCTGQTLWAPEMYAENGTYHMWLTVVPGVYKNWRGNRFIVHLTSPDLKSWHCADKVDTGTDRSIDATVVKKDGVYSLWFKDEAKGSRLFRLTSTDMKNWVRQPDPVIDTNMEGPKVFSFGGHYWMIADVWKGLMVLRSDDLKNWPPQPNRILEKPGTQPTDDEKGQHPDVVVNEGKAFIYYFVHQKNAPEVAKDPSWWQRTVVQVAEIKIGPDGWLTVDRDAPVDARLKAPK